MNCVTTADFVIGQAALAAAVLHRPVRGLLADVGLVAPPEPEVARDARTIAFLRGLDLDPVEVLGEQVVAAADEWARAPYVAAPPRRITRGSRRPIGAHSRLATA